ncbi:hypothetical protein [Duganella sp. S19_KUP01_CR8]|uniref:hypothetical protein n=1 Tax=Duganella sp. S19_KUP01_CR8 TaxID=3025502 RepID=UPI002FCD6F6D
MTDKATCGGAASEHAFIVAGDSCSILMDFIEQTIALAPVDEKGAVREILVGIFRILYGPDFSALAENTRQGGDTLSMLREGLYQGVGALIEANGGDMAEMAKKATRVGKKRPDNDARQYRKPLPSRLH